MLPDGYIAFSEQSLQVRTELDDVTKRPRPDVTVFEQSGAKPVASQSTAVAPTWQAEIADTVVAEEYHTAVVIREMQEQGKLGKVVTRIELLVTIEYAETIRLFCLSDETYRKFALWYPTYRN